MKNRKPSDPLSWFYQAAIHGVTPQMHVEAIGKDPGVGDVNTVRYWSQCPHNQQHSANFLPWHRAYTHHFEKILRMHVEDDDFALPYWSYSHWDSPDWDKNRKDRVKFPKAFGVEKVDGVENHLFHAERNKFLCSYDHPYTTELPLSELTASAVDAQKALESPIFFGDTESTGIGGAVMDDDKSTRGLLEQSPHDQIHRVVGGQVAGTDGNGNVTFALGGMAVPPTAGFDPIFPVHHSNIDRLWAKWSRMPGKSWGALPNAAWFDEKPWYFFDTDGKVVNLPRRAYFDYRALGIRFADEDLTVEPLKLPVVVASTDSNYAAFAAVRTQPKLSFEISVGAHASAQAPTALAITSPSSALAGSIALLSDTVAAQTAPGGVMVELKGITFHGSLTTGYDVYLVETGRDAQTLKRDDPAFLGSLSLFNHIAGHDHSDKLNQTFFAKRALGAAPTKSLKDLSVVIVPYELATPPKTTGIPLPPPGMVMVESIAVTVAAP